MVENGMFVLTGDLPFFEGAISASSGTQHTTRIIYSNTGVQVLLQPVGGYNAYCGVVLVDARANPKKPKMHLKQQFGTSVVLLTLILRDGPYVCDCRSVSLSFSGQSFVSPLHFLC